MNTRNLIALTLVLSLFALASSVGNDTRFLARLSGAGKGKAVYKIDTGSRTTVSELQIEGENLPRNTNVTVFIGDDVWKSRTNGFGTFEVRERWTGSPLKVGSGTPVVVVSESSGTKLLTGSFSQI